MEKVGSEGELVPHDKKTMITYGSCPHCKTLLTLNLQITIGSEISMVGEDYAGRMIEDEQGKYIFAPTTKEKL